VPRPGRARSQRLPGFLGLNGSIKRLPPAFMSDAAAQGVSGSAAGRLGGIAERGPGRLRRWFDASGLRS